jgi:predicted dehydrogenase
LKSLRAGIAGYGVVGERRHKVIDEHPNLCLAAIADLKFDEKTRVEGEVSYFKKYQDMIDDAGLDVLFVSLPNDVAPDATIAGLEAGCHVFCEKPPGRTVDDVKRVIAAEQRADGLKLKYGFNHRYHDSVREALRIAKSGELGTVVNIRGVYGKSAMIPWPRPSAPSLNYSGERFWRTNRAVAGGGILLDQGIHMVDLMRAFAGEFSNVKSFVRNSHWKHDVEDNAYALLETKDGVVAMLHSTATQWRHRFSLEVFLTEGALILSGILSGTKSYGQEQLTIVYRDDADQGNPQETTQTYIRDNSWRDEIFEFADLILNDRPVEIGSSAEALKTMQLVYDIYRADAEWQSA